MPERNRGAIKIKRAYETPAEHDGTRILVDRLWPRGVRKQDAAIDHWFKDVAPSRHFVNGSTTIPPVGRSFSGDIEPNCRVMW